MSTFGGMTGWNRPLHTVRISANRERGGFNFLAFFDVDRN